MISLFTILPDSSFDVTICLALIVFGLPLFVFFFLIFFGRVVNKYRGVGATTVMTISFLLSVIIFINTYGGNTHLFGFEWLRLTDSFSFDFGIYVDSVTAMMLLVVNFVSLLVHLFSIEYLKGDKHFEKYFAYLGLFTFSMIGILLANNLFQLFVYWELVGLSSYFLIGFYFTKESAVYSNKKAFIVNRIGDAGFLMGIMVLYHYTNSLTIIDLPSLLHNIPEQWLMVAGFGIFLGCMGKSAQFPLQVWLPNAMEGPTPVSALIHAATMVAAGVYLLFRMNFLFIEEVSLVITVIGAITSFLGAFAAISQTDIKRVLAFSTISQLGYMVMGMGVGAYDASMFHLLTHAFFKACLFLSAGAVINSMHHVEVEMRKEGLDIHFDAQDMRLMGGLRKRMPVTFYAYIIATASLAGLPFFSGFLSKDAIITSLFAWASDKSMVYMLVPIVAVFTAFLTAFYMSRQVFMIYFHDFRLDKFYPQLKGAYDKVIETPMMMRLPIIILSSLSLFFVFSLNPFDTQMGWFSNIIHADTFSHSLLHDWHLTASIFSVLAGAIGIVYSYYEFGRKDFVIEVMDVPMKDRSFLTRLSFNHWYLDEFFNLTVVRLQLILSSLISWLDKNIIDGIVNGLANLMVLKAKAIYWIDQHIIDKFVEIIAYKQVILAWVIYVFEKYVVDGLVNYTGAFAKLIGRVSNKLQGGQVQLYIFSSVILLMLLMLKILL